jgi:hypothetical protein
MDGRFGQNRDVFGNLGRIYSGASARDETCSTRAETVAKDILDAGFHPIGTATPAVTSAR